MLVLDRLSDILRWQGDEELERGPQAAFEAARDRRDHRRFRIGEAGRRQSLSSVCGAAVRAVAEAKHLHASNDRKVIYPGWFGKIAPHVEMSGIIQQAVDASMAAPSVLPVVFPAQPFALQVNHPIQLVNPLSLADAGGPMILGSGRNATVFDNQVAGTSTALAAMFEIHSTAGLNTFLRGGHLRDFSITTTTNPVFSHGIRIRAWWQSHIENVQIVGMSGSGFVSDCQVGDADGSTETLIDNCWFVQNGRFGIETTNGTPQAVEISWPVLRGTYCMQNVLGGMSIRALGLLCDNSAFALNCLAVAGVMNPAATGGVQMRVDHDATDTSLRDMIFRSCDFENNGIGGLDIQSCIEGMVDDTDFLYTQAAVPTGTTNTFGIRFGSITPGLVQNVFDIEVTHSVVRVDAANYTQFVFGRNSQYCEVRDTFWGLLSGAGAQRFNFNFTATNDPNNFSLIPQIEDDGVPWPRVESNNTNNAAASGATPNPYTPNAIKFTNHFIYITTPGNFTINNPVTSNNTFTGVRILFEIINATSPTQNIFVQWGTQYLLRGYTDPNPSGIGGIGGQDLYRIVEFVFDNVTGWKQVAASHAVSTIQVNNPAYSANPIPANSTATWTATFPGAALNDAVLATPLTGTGLGAGLTWSSWISGAGSVTVIVANCTTAPITPNPINWRLTLAKP